MKVANSYNHHQVFAPKGGYVPEHLREHNEVPKFKFVDIPNTINSNMMKYSEEANFDFDHLPSCLKFGEDLLGAYQQGHLGESYPLKNKQVIVNTGTEHILYEVNVNDKYLGERIGYEIEQAIGVQQGRVDVYVKHPETRKRMKIGDISPQDLWKINDPNAFTMKIDKNESPRSPSTFNKKELSDDELVKSNLKVYSKQLSADISRSIACQIDTKDWLNSSKRFITYSNVMPFVAGSIANPNLYNDGNHAKFLKNHGVIYPQHMVNQLSQRVAGNVQDMRKSEQLKAMIATSDMNSRQVQDKIGVHMTKLMSGCGLYSWLKYRWLRSRKVVRNWSRWRDKREDCLGLISLTSSDDDMMADTDSSDDGLSDGDSSSSDSDDSDKEIHHYYYQSKQKKYSLLSNLVHGGENLAKEAAYIVTGGSLTRKNKKNNNNNNNASSSSYRIEKPKKTVKFQKSEGGNIYQQGYGNQTTYVDDRDNNIYLGDQLENNLTNTNNDNNDICFDINDDINDHDISDQIFRKHWNENKQHIQAPFSKSNEYVIFFPIDKLAKKMNMSNPNTIKSSILNHSAVFPTSREFDGTSLTTIRGTNTINISNDGKLVNGKPAGELEILYDADTGYKLWVKPISVLFN